MDKQTCWVLTLVIASSSGCENPAPDNQALLFNGIWREGSFCGRNCLVVFLLSHGFDVQYDKPILRKGSETWSFNSLQKIIRDHGMQVRMGKVSRADLKDLPMPIIAHLDDPQGRPLGHYVLVLKSSEDSVLIMDGTTLGISNWRWRQFQKLWSGYVLTNRPEEAERARRSRIVLISTMCGIIFTLFLFLSSHLGRTKKAKGAFLGRIFR